MSSFALHTYLERFPEVCRKEFNKVYDFSELERGFSYLRSADRYLVPKHIETLFDPERTPFAKYWACPSMKELEIKLDRRRVSISLEKTEAAAKVQELLGLFHNIGIVSIVLRFVYPERFGIFSTPVIDLLNVRRASTIDLYLAYCGELQAWRTRFKLKSAAEVEMALWAFHKIAKTPEGEDSRFEFEEDTWIQRQRLDQALGPFLQRYGWLDLAYILAKREPNVAGLIAGREYVRLLKQEASRLGINSSRKNEWWEAKTIDALAKEIPSLDAPDMKKVWKKRCDVSHDQAELDEAEAEWMIERIRRFRDGIVAYKQQLKAR